TRIFLLSFFAPGFKTSKICHLLRNTFSIKIEEHLFIGKNIPAARFGFQLIQLCQQSLLMRKEIISSLQSLGMLTLGMIAVFAFYQCCSNKYFMGNRRIYTTITHPAFFN